MPRMIVADDECDGQYVDRSETTRDVGYFYKQVYEGTHWC